MADRPKKTSEIVLKVSLNDKNIPVDIKWKASDSEKPALTDAKAFNLSIWDPVEQNSLSMNLWTTDMRIDEMHAHFFRTIVQLASSYHQATKNPFVLDMIKSFAKDLSIKTSDWEESKQKNK